MAAAASTFMRIGCRRPRAAGLSRGGAGLDGSRYGPGVYRIMGVVNVTPDSFSDGGAFLDRDAAVNHGLRLAFEGADLLDVGGESTRPGAEPVSEREELDRVIPVIEGIRAGNPASRISIDTSKAAVAAAALDAGADYVNDVTALRGDPEMAALVAERGVDVCLMHMLGTPRTMQAEARYDDVVADVKAFLAERIEAAVAAGIAVERIEVDPGIGFAKTLDHNLELLRRLGELTALGRPIVLGTSRKSFLGTITGPRDGRAGARDARHDRDGLRARRGGVPRPRRRPGARRPRRGGCYVAARMADDAEDYDDDDLNDDEESEGPEVGVTIEIVGLSLYTHHGVTAAEREIGQRLVLDVRFDVGEPDALVTDRVEDTVDYGEVCQVIALIAQQRSYKTLERLCAVIADRLASQFNADSVTVKASKPEPPIPLPVEEVSVEVWREER